MPAKREIMYPFLLECIPYCSDPFWENVFEDLAYGKPPQNTFIVKNNLCCTYKNREFNYFLERKDPKMLYTDIFTLLNEKGRLLSAKQKEQHRLDFQQIEDDIRESRREWNGIRKKYIRDAIYEKYVLEMKNKFDLTFKQCRWLLSVISLSLLFKTLTSKDIVFRDNAITEIKGIQFQPRKIIFAKRLTNDADEGGNEEDEDEGEKEVKTLSDLWNRYLHYLKNING